MLFRASRTLILVSTLYTGLFFYLNESIDKIDGNYDGIRNESEAHLIKTQTQLIKTQTQLIETQTQLIETEQGEFKAELESITASLESKLKGNFEKETSLVKSEQVNGRLKGLIATLKGDIERQKIEVKANGEQALMTTLFKVFVYSLNSLVVFLGFGVAVNFVSKLVSESGFSSTYYEIPDSLVRKVDTLELKANENTWLNKISIVLSFFILVVIFLSSIPYFN